MQIIKTLFKTIRHCQEGGVMALIGVSLALLVGATGTAIDTSRTQQVQSKLSSSLDAAGLAAGSTISTTNLHNEAYKYLQANFNNHLNAIITDFSAVANADNTIITLNATATVPTTLMKVLGFESNQVSASSEITRASKGLELAMVLDNTGSMYGSKLTSLKSAATDLVNILHGDGGNNDDNLFIGLVPFSQSVNIGSGRASWTLAGSNHWGTASWSGCVDARITNNRDVTDDPPAIAAFNQYYWACDDNINEWYGTNRNRTNCRLSSRTRYRTDMGIYRGPNKYCPQPVTGMTASKTIITDAIDAMQAVGYTHINLGAAWGWRMLSPRWRGLWGGEMNSQNLPLDYNAENMNKAVIIMTDGDNTMSHYSQGAYGYLHEGILGTTSSSAARTQLDNRLLQVCASMKQQNIIVYTVSFGTVSSASQTMMQQCASQPDYYFHSPNSTELQASFRAIGDSLASLRVSR